MKKPLLLLMFIFSLAFAAANKISMPVAGLLVQKEKNIYLDFDWDEKWFGAESAFEYNHNLARISTLFSLLAYADDDNHGNDAIVEAYEKLGAKREDISLHYDINKSDEFFGIDQCAFSFALDEIDSSLGKKNLVFVSIRGTVMSYSEWLSNLNVSDTTNEMPKYHEGFVKCTNKILMELYFFIQDKKIDTDDCFFLITGHSRGAAVANLLASFMADSERFDTKKIYAYTIATPNVTRSETVDDEKYNFIWNIINDEDLVPILPLKKGWGFDKFGRTRATVSLWNSDDGKYLSEYIPRMNDYYNKLLGRDYVPFNTGGFIPGVGAEFMSEKFPDMKSYYKRPFGFKSLTKALLRKVIPSNEDLLPSEIFELADRFHSQRSKDKFNEIMYSIFDMHIAESYLSWIMALDEEEFFCNAGSTRIRLKGNFDLAVFDQNETPIARIIDGYVQMEDSKHPVGALTIPGQTFLGFPSNQNFIVAIYKDSMIPTPIEMQIEQLDAESNLISAQSVEGDKNNKNYNRLKILPHAGNVYVFRIGKGIDTQESIEIRKYTGKLKNLIIEDGVLDQFRVFRFQPEVNFGTDFYNIHYFEFGAHAGTRLVYGSFLVSFPEGGFQMAPGVGHEQTVVSRLMLNIELFGRCRWPKEEEFQFIPGGRLALSYKPVHYFQIFGAYDIGYNLMNDEFEHAVKIGIKF